MTPEQMQKIVDSAPDKATGYITQSNDYFYGQKWVKTMSIFCQI